MSRRTKTIIGVVAALLLIALGVFLYFWWNRGALIPPDLTGTFPPPTDEITPGEKPPVVLPEEARGPFEPILRQLTKVPIAGAVLGARSGEQIVRYQERATGNAYEIEADGEGEKRLTNTTIPKVYEALWSKTGTALIARYARDGSETIESFSARIVQGTAGKEGELQGVFLPRDIMDASVSPDGAALFYLQEKNGGAIGIRSDFEGDGKTQLWTSPVSEWLAAWPSANKITLLSKPSFLASGMLISLDPGSGATALLLRNIPGLTALLNPVTPDILYSVSAETNISLALVNSATGKRSDARFTTFPEKCAWSKNGERLYCGVPKVIPTGSYPDVWYQGVVSFEDEAWSLTTATGATERILDISGKRGIPIDLTRPEVSADEKFLIFTDKESGTLWSLQMKE